MQNRGFWHLKDVPDAQLRSGLSELLAAGYRTEARIVAHLAEVERRKLHLIEGSESLFDYCIRVLRLSNSESFHRITVARIAQHFPIVFELLDRREVHLTAVCLLRDYLTPENHRELLREACHKTKWQVRELLARRFPRPDVESRIRKLPDSRSSATSRPGASPTPAVSPLELQPDTRHRETPPSSPGDRAAGASERHESLPVQCALPVAVEPKAPPTPARPFPIEPLSEARYRIQLNASAALKDKLERLRALTSHSNPSGDIAVVIERALDLALERVEKQRFAKTNRPRASLKHFVQTKCRPGRLRSAIQQREHVPHAVLREVAERDGLRCTFRSTEGHRCTARAFLQVHHEVPWARGGDEAVDNLRLLCAAHNQLLAERDFGSRVATPPPPRARPHETAKRERV